MLRGISRYVTTHRPWSFTVDERGLDDPPPRWLESWRGEGIITRSRRTAVVEAARRTEAPVVHLGEHREAGLPMVHSDDDSIARVAVDHLLDSGVRQLGFVGVPARPWSEARRSAFARLLAERGLDERIFELPAREATAVGRERQDDRLARWLLDLGQPAGVFAGCDVLGLRVLDVCRRAGIAVPEQVAVIGVDNDTLLCSLADPPLSSVAHDLDRIGYEAAALLERSMGGGVSADVFQRVDPAGVVSRQSTDLVAIADEAVARAVSFIRNHACDGINVEDVLRHVPLSRVTLGRRFEKILGRSPKAEILRVRIERCRHLLEETDFSQEAIARLAGFRHPEYLNVVFKRETGQTPGEYRKVARRNAVSTRGG